MFSPEMDLAVYASASGSDGVPVAHVGYGDVHPVHHRVLHRGRGRALPRRAILGGGVPQREVGRVAPTLYHVVQESLPLVRG